MTRGWTVSPLSLALALAACSAAAPPPPSPSLEGVTWRLTGAPGIDPASLADESKAPNLRFEAGRVSGFAGCNRLGGTYTLDGDRLKLGMLSMTKMACPGDAMTVENAFARVFTGELVARVSGDRLTLDPPSGEPLELVAMTAP
jgi:heat shock protein HslJ